MAILYHFTFWFLVIGILKFNFLSYLYDIRVSNNGIEFFVLTFFKIYTLTFSNIDFIKAAKAWHPFIAYNFKNRPFQKAFLVSKKKAWFARRILITPSDPELFTVQLVYKGVDIIH
jgi:hypothetical protein